MKQMNRSLAAWWLCVSCAVLAVPMAHSQTTIFSDNFNSGVIDANKWTTSGNTVLESGGVMQVLTTVTDQGGVLTSVPVPISPHGDIMITRSAFLHYANEYFVGDMLVKFGSLGWAGVNYANYFYPSTYYGWEDRYGIYLSRNNVGGWPPFINSSSDTDVSDPFSPIWDTWFNEKLVYSPDTGSLQYFINGQKMADYFIGVMPATSNPTIQFQFRAWGWWTGHEQLFDNFVVTQNAPSSCDLEGVPLLKQGCGQSANCPYVSCPSAPWSCDLYGNYSTYPNTISMWGCYLTSCAMLINYQASVQGVAFSTTPSDLNAWLKQNNGYDSDSNVNPDAVAKYARQYGVSLWYDGPLAGVHDDVVASYLCAGNPVLMEVLHGSYPHFVLATGQTVVNGINAFRINDPGYPNSTLAGYGFTYQGIRKFSSTPSPAQALVIRAHSPVELLLSDSSGHQTGFDPATGQHFNQITNGTYTLDSIGNDEDPTIGSPETKVLDIRNPGNGSYVLHVFGTGLGLFSIDLIGYDTNGAPSFNTITGVTDAGVETSYTMTYNSSTNVTLTALHHIVTISNIIAEVKACRNLGLIDNDGIANSLSQKLNNANSATSNGNTTAAQNILNAFVNEVSAQTGKHIQSDAANLLIGDASSMQ